MELLTKRQQERLALLFGDPRAVQCPDCGARAGFVCARAPRKPVLLNDYHKGRKEAWKLAQ